MTEEQRTTIIAEGQARAWRDAQSVMIAQVVDAGLVPGGPPIFRQATFASVLQLKGQAPSGDFTTRQTVLTLCGAYPAYHPLVREPDDFYVVLASKSWGEDEAVSNIYRLSFVTDPDILAAWRAAFAARTPQ